MANTPERPGPMLAIARRSALFKTEQFCLFSGVAAPNLGCVVQDYIQQ
jgi:hypothetical protein